MPDADALESVDQLRLKAFEQISTLDRAFFDDLESLVSDEHVQKVARLQTRRLRQMYTANAVGMFGMNQSAEGGIDLVEIVERAEDRTFEVDELQRIDSILATYEQAATDLFRKRFDAKLAFQRCHAGVVCPGAGIRSGRGDGVCQAVQGKDLTEQQRDRLDLLATTHDPEYLRLSKAMVAHVGKDTTNMMNFEAGDWQEYQKRQEQMQLIRFDRDELCYRAITKLKVILSAEQIKRIGSLPAPQKDLGTIYR